jgi:hypothetical protein
VKINEPNKLKFQPPSPHLKSFSKQKKKGFCHILVHSTLLMRRLLYCSLNGKRQLHVFIFKLDLAIGKFAAAKKPTTTLFPQVKRERLKFHS